jgi:prephenate dehydrogenase
VLGHDIRPDTLTAAAEQGVIDGVLTNTTLSECDLVILALYPGEINAYCEQILPHMRKDAVLLDCAGVKSRICREISALARRYSVRFVGGHPMAGVERAGYENSFAELFNGATMILCEDEHTDPAALAELRSFFLSLGFGSLKITDASAHDAVIAYTSQLAHLISSAYVHSKTLPQRYGFSAGSYKDLSRVAKLSPDMWAALFRENRENLLRETDAFIEKMREYREALKEDDIEKMTRLLESGNNLKIRDEAEEENWRKANSSLYRPSVS